MESVRSAFHAQLATVMDTLLAAAVCEIAKIFESSLCEHQAELLQKTKEISILRGELQKVEQRHRAKGTRSDVDEKPTSEREDCGNQDTVNASDKVQTPNQNFSGFKEESDGLEGAAAVKHEQTGSPSNQESVGVQASELNLEKGQTEPLFSAQCKDKLSHWNHSRHTAAQLHEDDAPTPLLSLKVRSDTSRTEGWFPGLSTTEEPTIENLRINGSNCGPMNGRTVRDTVFGFDETRLEDDSTFPFLHQEPENHGSSPNMVEGQEMEQSGARGPINHTRRGSTFSSRDPLQPQSNLHTLALRNMNSLSNPPAATGGNGRPYTCPYCTKCFTYPSHQRRHLLRHTGVRLHQCQFCEKSFLTPSELTVHTRTHTGERPFGCAQCGKRFARSGNLRAHQRDVHLGKRPFACTECGKRFAHRGNLRVHNHRVHQGDPYFLHESHIDPDTV